MDRVQSESMDLPITLDELQQAVAEAAPGLDGLPMSFMQQFYTLLGGALWRHSTPCWRGGP